MSPRAVKLAGFAALFGALVACGNDEPLEVAEAVDLAHFQGKWHEIAHLARTTQDNCIGTTATYAPNPDGTFSFVHECTVRGGGYKGATAIAKVPDARAPAKLTVDFGGYTGDYWIIEVAPDYRYAVVGHPSRDYLWILSRSPTMDPADLNAALAHANAKSFDTSKLEYTLQGSDPQGTPAAPAKYGCAFTPGPAQDAGAGAWFFGLGLLVVARRRRSISATSRG